MQVKDKLKKLLGYLSGKKSFIIRVLGAVLAIAIWWFLPKYQVMSLEFKAVKPDRIVEIEDKTRGTITQVFGGLVVVFSAYVAWKRMVDSNKAQEDQLRVALSGQVTDRYLRAVELLNAEGDENITKRLGGIYSMERIALDSADDRRAVMEVLTAYVRTKSPVRNEPRNGDIPTDIQAILTVISRINDVIVSCGEHIIINLFNTDLSCANLFRANMNRANMNEAHLNGVHLELANLNGAYLCRAYLDGAHLHGADLRGADLFGAKDFTQEQLDSAITDETTLISPPLKIKTNSKETSSQSVSNI